DALLPGVDSGRFDIICNGVGYTEERAKSYSFTTPYVYSNKVLVVAENNEEIKTVDDLKGKKTANSASSTYAALAEEYGATLVPVDTLGETMDMLVQGRVDATINAQVSIADYLREHPEAKIKVVQVLAGDPVAYPLHIGEEYQSLVNAINDVLEAARQDGRLAEISMKYFGVDMTKAE
ncbi:MAG: transporter substrate-binding domain-containing protein, partial [Clostridia bacterium]|nr:transporter substrate-binding domain-containing protein [Clostridia bacterium]